MTWVIARVTSHSTFMSIALFRALVASFFIFITAKVLIKLLVPILRKTSRKGSKVGLFMLDKLLEFVLNLLKLYLKFFVDLFTNAKGLYRLKRCSFFVTRL